MKSSYNTLSSLGLYSWGALIATFPTQPMRGTALATLIFFTWAVLEPWNLAHAQDAPLGRGSVVKRPQQKAQRAAEKFEQALRTLKQKSDKLDEQSVKGEATDAELDSVDAISQTIKTLDGEV